MDSGGLYCSSLIFRSSCLYHFFLSWFSNVQTWQFRSRWLH